MRTRLLATATLVVFLNIGTSANGDYAVTGKVSGDFCADYLLFMSCGPKEIDATTDYKGQLVYIATAFDEVDSYENGRCSITIHQPWFPPLRWFNWVISWFPQLRR